MTCSMSFSGIGAVTDTEMDEGVRSNLNDVGFAPVFTDTYKKAD